MGTDSKEPFFSIIIPVYQCENTLGRCIESVLSQDECDYQVILVDDGSTDESKKICDFYFDNFPDKFLVIHKENEGPLFARIDAVKAAGGQYLMFLDADDTYRPDALSQVKHIIEVCQADMVIFNYFRVLTNGNIQLYPPQYTNEKVFEGSDLEQLYVDAVTGVNLNALWQKCIHRDLLTEAEDFRKYGRMLIGEDKLLSLSMIDRASKVVYLADGLYEYYVLQQSISHSFTLKHYQDMAKVHLQTLNYIAHWKLNDGRILCYASKVEFGLTCLYSVASKILLHQTDFSEFAAIARQIIADKEYWIAFGYCKSSLAIHKRVICWLLSHKTIHLVLICFCADIIMKRR